MNEAIEIECPKCKAKIRVHQPIMVVNNDEKVAQVTLIPSWSLDERKCTKCACAVAPIIAQIQASWVAYEMKTPAGIVQPNGQEMAKVLEMKRRQG